MNLPEFRTWIFDCDGVILDSNSLKSDAFYEVTRKFGEGPARDFVQYHKTKGGVSRYEKFRYFFEHILMREEYEKDLAAVLDEYGKRVRSGLLEAPVTPGLTGFLQLLPADAMKIVVTGGDEREIREVLEKRDLNGMFDRVYGSPMSKADIVERGIRNGLIRPPVAYIGDSRLDYEIADGNGFAFIFLSGFSEFAGWESYFRDKPRVLEVRTFEDLIRQFNAQPVSG